MDSWFCLSIPRSVDAAIAGPKEAKNPAGAKSSAFRPRCDCAPFIREQCGPVCQASPNFNVGSRLIIPLNRSCYELSKQPSQIHAGLRCVGNSSGNETGGSVNSPPKRGLLSCSLLRDTSLYGGRNRLRVAV